MRIKILCVGLLVFTSVLFSNCPANSATQIAQVALQDYADIERLQRAGLDISYLSPGSMATVILPSAREQQILIELGLPYFISVSDAEGYFASRIAETRRDDMGGYKTFAEIVAEMNRLYREYDNIIAEPFSIGQSIEGRPLWVLKVSDNPEDDEEDEPDVFYTALIHCREVITPEVLFGVIRHLAENYEEDERVTNLVNERQMFFLLCHNPDGYVHNEQTNPNGGGMWRKNRRRNDNGSYGVDLNRNYGYRWGFDNIGSTNNPSDDTYRGTSAFSEPETEAVRRFVNNRRIAVSINFHSYSNLCLYPIGYNFLQPADLVPFNALGRKMTTVNNYLLGTPWEIIYRVNGNSDDWLYASDEHIPIFAYTVEVGTNNDNFWPALNRVQTLVRENIEGCLAAAEYADNPFRALRPTAPGNVLVNRIGNDSIMIGWNQEEDEVNPAQFYRIKAQIPEEPFYDDLEEDNGRWEAINFTRSQVDRHSGESSYRLTTNQIIATLTLSEEIALPETLWAWTNYNFRTNLGHGLACEVSANGYEWHPLTGLETRNLVMNNNNLGPVLTAASDGWQRIWWLSGNFSGEMQRIRFRFYQFGTRRLDEFCYIDDIGPLPGYRFKQIIANRVEEFEFMDEFRDEEIEYAIQSVDAEGDASFWSVPAKIGDVTQLTLTLPAGWSLISAPVITESRIPEILFELTERSVLRLFKDGKGQFFAPGWDFNQTENWDPLAGYFLQLTDNSQVSIPGDMVPSDTPIPLAAGWNNIAYLPSTEMPVRQALESVQDNLIFVKDGFGRFWNVAEDFSNLPDLSLGSGYQLKLSEPDTLIYPNYNQQIVRNVRIESPFAYDFIPSSTDNHSLLIILKGVETEGTLYIKDSNNNIAGQAHVTQTDRKIGCAVWGKFGSDDAGYKDGDTFSGIWIEKDNSTEMPLFLDFVSGDPLWSKDGFTIFKASIEENSPPEEARLLRAYPNPFNSRVVMQIRLQRDEIAAIAIYDATGRETAHFSEISPNGAQKTVVWDAGTIPAGLYIAELRLKGNGYIKIERQKLLLIR